jgi:hypothetical protein
MKRILLLVRSVQGVNPEGWEALLLAILGPEEERERERNVMNHFSKT